MTSTDKPTELMREHAWRYFELHANQRMTVFNFFLVLSGLATAGLATVVQGAGDPRFLGAVLGLLLALVSFVFWKLDQRASFFIKRAEVALAEVEQSFLHPRCRLFLGEPDATRAAMVASSPWRRHWTYGRSFRVVFIAMALFEMVGSAVSVTRSTARGSEQKAPSESASNRALDRTCDEPTATGGRQQSAGRSAPDRY
jgi:hypothetical protein